jgi:hypothetical protein
MKTDSLSFKRLIILFEEEIKMTMNIKLQLKVE